MRGDFGEDASRRYFASRSQSSLNVLSRNSAACWKDKRGERGRQICLARHGGATDKDGNDLELMGKCGGQLMAHIVRLLFLRALAQDLVPARPDHNQGGLAGRDRPIDGFREILAGHNVFDVHEDAIRTDDGGEVIAQTAGICGGVLAAVADEDTARG